MNLRSAAASASMANTSSRSNTHIDLFVPVKEEVGEGDVNDDDEVVAAVCANASSSSKHPPIPAIAVSDWLRRVGVHRGQVLLIAAARDRRVSIDSVDQDTPCRHEKKRERVWVG